MNFPSGVLEYVQNYGDLDLKWRLPRDIGDNYEEQTAKEMLLWSIQDCPNMMLYSFQPAYSDQNYIYGYARLIYGGDSAFTITVTGLESYYNPNVPATIVLSYNP